MPILAAYGSLRNGEANHSAHLKGCPCHGIRRMKGFALYDAGNHAYAVPDRDDAITVELFTVMTFHLITIDELLGTPMHHRRIYTAAGFYLYVTTAGRVAHLPRIASGDWKRRDVPRETIGPTGIV